MSNFIDLKDLSKDQLLDLISLSIKWKKNPSPKFMNDKQVVLIFEKPSLRKSSQSRGAATASGAPGCMSTSVSPLVTFGVTAPPAPNAPLDAPAPPLALALTGTARRICPSGVNDVPGKAPRCAAIRWKN